jgi:ABC-type nickel/cobalt efflux system permease component RcnA
MRRLHSLLVALALLAAGLGAALGGAALAQTNPFGRGTPSTPAGPAPESRRDAAPPAETGVIDRWYAAIRRWQSELTRSLAVEVRAYKEEGSLRPVLALLLVSFLYGVAHAIGPGHGKAATAAYFGANRAHAANGITMSAMIGLVQALSAVVFVGAFALLFKVSQTQTVRSVLYVEVASYALIAGVGLWIAWGGVIGRGCTHNHGPGGHAHHDHARDHRHHHAHAHGHAHAHAHRHDDGPALAAVAPGAPASTVTLRSMLPVALASGLRPCTGAILVLLFTLSQGIFEIGVLATVVMSFGTFLVVALIGLGVIYARRAASRAGGRHERLANLAQRGVSLAGGLIVAAFGALFLLSSLQQLGYRI